MLDWIKNYVEYFRCSGNLMQIKSHEGLSHFQNYLDPKSDEKIYLIKVVCINGVVIKVYDIFSLTKIKGRYLVSLLSLKNFNLCYCRISKRWFRVQSVIGKFERSWNANPIHLCSNNKHMVKTACFNRSYVILFKTIKIKMWYKEF